MRRITASRTSILLTLTVTILLGLGAIAIVRSQNSTGGSNINFGPPTQEEQEAGDDRKQEIVDEESRPTGTQKNANIIIVDASQYGDEIEIRSFINNVLEDGTCTITLRKDNDSITRQVPAHKDVSTTICSNVIIKRSDFPSSGLWNVSVSYKSSSASGTSETQTVTIN